ncbi:MULTISPECIES: efflux RND transporter periplasmic adaptor subunit [unclassified Polaromonas]|jgi:cobalt-zinc-cadmium efflux system membrane fusion protein|uniref:efflux RND transporter periplasmic adaptor subunit n=1 Tax=unclassified Polaromonas TaxID=2638319 RepID=UPI000BD3E7E1|nr:MULTISPECIES: efflux RND transporter periplasmic adaptor subunit [unclassified Polaromonas]OYY33260.1 MAG: efflux transporter periplasmic adaptor subunit [Polaromonas sp. 35-63-35]OYZ17535.1 MAG: efflux transporter periplasmic adaptor subunit [Polaromonas sp. 16-63-31]OYZ76653.1 MAG: efflux transporter periplasmic adaptor subunit [Polaromonas sp. 24-63-21]OZA47822.1 MAG: efflux transporter periplasmic adaptor subunit [Polaromonas sp. 17-63-33]OZA85859.1 MAG: efflux transporter periplasmic a
MNNTKFKFSTSRRVVGISSVLAILLMLGGCGDKSAKGVEPAKQEAKAESGKEEKGLKLTAEEQERAGIKLEEVSSRTFEDSVSVTATIRPNQDRIAKISPRVEGRIVSVSANLGDTVRAGQALAVMDSLAIGEAQSTLLRAQSSERVAQADFKRAESLSAEEIIPQKELLRARGELERASAESRAARDRLRLLGGSASASGHAQSTFALTSPFAGTVIQKKATIGELGSPSDAIFTIADLSKVWIEANLTDQLVSKVKTGAAAIVTVGAYPGEHFNGRVAYIANVLDKDSRTIAARIEVPNKDGRLKPEMFASASIATGGQLEAISVPDTAIVLLQGQPTVFVNEQGSFESRAVETGEKLGGRTVITSGLKTKEQVVATGAYALKARLLKSQIGG